MVDFQSRDRGRDDSSDDETPDEESEAESEASETEGESEAEGTATDAAEGRTETAAGSGRKEAADSADDSGSPPAADETTQSDSGASGSEGREGQEGAEGEAHVGEYVEIDADAEESGRDHGQGHSAHDHSGHGHGNDHGHDHGHGHGNGHGHDHAGHDHGHEVETLGVALITISSSRTIEEDPSGDVIRDSLEADGHEIAERDLVVDDLDSVQRAVLAVTERKDVDVVVTTGGTGVTPDDVTIEAIEPLFDKKLPGFGELFRILSYEEVGTRALGTRATAGVSEGVPVFCLPGSENAVRLGVEELILPEMSHLVGLAQRS